MQHSHVHITSSDYAIFLKHFSALLQRRRYEVEAEKTLLSGACSISETIAHRVDKSEGISCQQIHITCALPGPRLITVFYFSSVAIAQNLTMRDVSELGAKMVADHEAMLESQGIY